MLLGILIAERAFCNPISSLAEFQEGLLLSSMSLREELSVLSSYDPCEARWARCTSQTEGLTVSHRKALTSSIRMETTCP